MPKKRGQELEDGLVDVEETALIVVRTDVKTAFKTLREIVNRPA